MNGAHLQGTVEKWGNSAAVRIPASVPEAAHLRLAQPIDVRKEDGRVVIGPLRPVRYDIDALVAGITEEGAMREADVGSLPFWWQPWPGVDAALGRPASHRRAAQLA